MPTPPTPPRPPAAPSPNAGPITPGGSTGAKVKITRGRDTRQAQRVIVYGTGGIGKTSLCGTLETVGRSPIIIDVEDGSRDLDVARIPADAIQDLKSLRSVLADDDLFAPFDTIVIDSATKVEDLVAAEVCREANVDKLEDVGGGFGKGYRAVYERFLALLGDLDAHVRAGRSVVLICHSTTARVPNPGGADFIRYEPRLYQNDKNSLRDRVKEWSDHVFAVLYDVDAKDNKAKGSGTRTIYTREMPTHIAKSRTLRDAYPFAEGDAAIWRALFGA